jgi:hypothetical protein
MLHRICHIGTTVKPDRAKIIRRRKDAAMPQFKQDTRVRSFPNVVDRPALAAVSCGGQFVPVHADRDAIGRQFFGAQFARIAYDVLGPLPFAADLFALKPAGQPTVFAQAEPVTRFRLDPFFVDDLCGQDVLRFNPCPCSMRGKRHGQCQ